MAGTPELKAYAGFSGRCLCGAVRYQITGRPLIVAQCHCEECRRLSGTGHSIGAMFPKANVTLQGDLREYSYQSAKATVVTKAFCAQCCSPIYGHNTGATEFMTFALGGLDDPKDLVVDVVIYERDKQAWDDLPDTATCFHTQPDWSPKG